MPGGKRVCIPPALQRQCGSQAFKAGWQLASPTLGRGPVRPIGSHAEHGTLSLDNPAFA